MRSVPFLGAASVLSALAFPQHQVTSFGSTLDEREETLAELFKARGYDTGAFVANVLQRAALDGAAERLQVHVSHGTTPNTPALDAETREQMRALGYTE